MQLLPDLDTGMGTQNERNTPHIIQMAGGEDKEAPSSAVRGLVPEHLQSLREQLWRD